MIVLFLASVVLLQTSSWQGYYYVICGAALLLLLVVPNTFKPLASLSAAYAAGFILHEQMETAILAYSVASKFTSELTIAVSRFSLIGYFIPLVLAGLTFRHRYRLLAMGSLSTRIYVPFSDRRLSDPIWRIVLITIAGNAAIFAFIMDWQHLGSKWQAWVGPGIVFALVNALLETMLWRGFILSQLIETVGTRFGLLAASLAFGLYHLSLVHHWWLCIAIAGGGIGLGLLAICSRGLLASALLHFVMNILFVMSGNIFHSTQG